MTDPVSLNDFRYRRALGNSTVLPNDAGTYDSTAAIDTADQVPIVDKGHHNTTSASVLRKLHPDTELGRFFDLVASAIATFDECSKELSSTRNLAADDKLMSARLILGELFVLREISDAVGVIVLSALEATSKVTAITDAPDLPTVCNTALRRLWAAPFMDFAEAAILANSIGAASNTEAMREFDSLVDELLAAQADNPPE